MEAPMRREIVLLTSLAGVVRMVLDQSEYPSPMRMAPDVRWT